MEGYIGDRSDRICVAKKSLLAVIQCNGGTNNKLTLETKKHVLKDVTLNDIIKLMSQNFSNLPLKGFQASIHDNVASKGSTRLYFENKEALVDMVAHSKIGNPKLVEQPLHL